MNENEFHSNKLNKAVVKAPSLFAHTAETLSEILQSVKKDLLRSDHLDSGLFMMIMMIMDSILTCDQNYREA